MRQTSLIQYRGLVLVAMLAVAVVITSVPAAAQASKNSKAVKLTSWGVPDFNGTWDARIQVPFQRARDEKREFYTDAEIAAKAKKSNDTQADINRQIAEGTYLAVGDRCFPVDPGIFRDASGGIDRPAEISKRTSAVLDPPNGRLPAWTKQQMARFEAREKASTGRSETDAHYDRNLGERCITSFAPAAGTFPTTRILQVPGYIAITNLEIGHAGEGSMRIIPLDGRPHLPQAIRQWQGDGRGRFEGDTLVIETTNHNDKNGPVNPFIFNNTYPGNGEKLRVTERLRLTSENLLEYRVTVEDPETYVKPFTVVREITRDDSYEMQPMSCHEGHRSIGGALAQARADEATALEYGVEGQQERIKKYDAMKKEWSELYPETHGGTQ